MKIVGVRELKDKLSSYIRAAHAGERVIVTDRGKAVAELRQANVAHAETMDAVQELIERGLLTPGANNRQMRYPRLKPLLPREDVLRLLDEERGEH